MTEPFHTRAAEIIAAYGADPARWPDAERATALHCYRRQPGADGGARRGADLDAVSRHGRRRRSVADGRCRGAGGADRDAAAAAGDALGDGDGFARHRWRPGCCC